MKAQEVWSPDRRKQRHDSSFRIMQLAITCSSMSRALVGELCQADEPTLTYDRTRGFCHSKSSRLGAVAGDGGEPRLNSPGTPDSTPAAKSHSAECLTVRAFRPFSTLVVLMRWCGSRLRLGQIQALTWPSLRGAYTPDKRFMRWIRSKDGPVFMSRCSPARK